MKLRLYSFLVATIVSVQLNALPITLKEIIVRSLESNDKLSSTMSKYKSEAQLYKEAVRRAFPAMDADFSKSSQKVPSAWSTFVQSETYNATVSLTQPIYLGGAIWQGLKFKKLLEKMSYQNYKLETISIQRQLLTWALQYKNLSGQVLSTSQSLKDQKEFVFLSRKKIKRGDAKKYEYQQSLSELYSYESRLKLLKNKKEAFKGKINSALKIDLSSPLNIHLPQEPKDLFITKLKMYEESIAARPEIVLAKLQIELQEVNKKLDMSVHLPSLNLVASMGYQSTNSNQLFENDSKKSSLLLSLKVPMFSALSSVNLKKSGELKVLEAKSKRNQLLRDLQVALEIKYVKFKSSRSVYLDIMKWKVAAIKAHKEGLSLYRRGGLDYSQVLQMQKARERAELSYLDSKQELYLSYYELILSLGRDVVKYL